jgi:two-component sensor histidine kinase
MRAETDVYVNEHRLLCKGGSYKWTLGRGKVIERDTDGKPLRVIGTQSDISRQKEAEERLSGYAESQRILLREVNHRVKNNLALIIGMVHMETRKAGDGPTDGILGAIEGRIQALSVVHSMLSSTEWRPIVLQVLCEQIVKGTIAPSRNAQVTISRSDVVVMASRAHNVALVMHELATNTCKHASGQEQLCVDIEVVAQGNDVLLKYRDSGPGFSKEVIAGDSRALGTGLKLLRGIVEMSLGGEIRFSNQDGAVAEIRFNAEILEDEGHAG